MTMLNKGLKPVLYDKDKAVSPIIATILLVAITVILASTLYLALGGFFSHTTTSTPTISLGATNTTTGTTTYTYTITTGASSGTMPTWSSTSWVITLNTGSTVTLTYSSSTSTFTSGNYTISGVSGNTVSSGLSLVLTIKTLTPGPSSIALMDTSSSGGGQMGTVSL